ncbi:MAG: DUF4382 domain-containing protein [Syntrophaceae bacterium]|nr:DUF4382 domain-containing protein [Syntrophaceae bacterium]
MAIFIKDGPTDDFEKILVTVTEVSLIPVSGAPVVIYENPSGCEIDLLQHRQEDFLLTIKRNVPAGTYSKIRLRVTNIDLVPKEGRPLVTEVKLPSGKIDLNPRGTFTVEPGGTLSIRLDMDANKAIHVHPSKRDRYIFRPVVFVKIETGFPAEICPKIVHGTITSLIKNSLNQTTGFVMALDDRRGTLDIKLTSGTDIFLASGDFGDAGDLEVGQEVRVRGQMDSSGALAASLVIIGDVLDVVGEVAGVVSSNVFQLTTFSQEEILGTYVVRIDPAKTLILTDCNTEVGPEAIQEGMVARVIGKLVGFELSAAVVVLRPKEVTGEITSASDVSGGRQLTVMPEGGTTGVQVFVPAAAPVYIEGDGQVSASYLTAGRHVRILLDPAIASPATAKTVFIVGQKVEGTVSSVGSDTMVVDGRTVRVPAGATVLDLRSGCSLVPFSTIRAGDKVVYFGLETTGADFEAPVVLIVD